MANIDFKENFEDMIFTLQGLYEHEWLWLNKIDYNHFLKFFIIHNFDFYDFSSNHQHAIKVFLYYSAYKNTVPK